MILPNSPVHLLDVNAVIALLDEAHVHHKVVSRWFDTPGLQWALCPFTEAGVLRFFTRPKVGELTIRQGTAMLDRLKQQPGYRFQPVTADWQSLTKPFFERLHGHKQVTDAFLLGIAIHHRLVLTTFDVAIAHLAGQNSRHIHVLKSA